MEVRRRLDSRLVPQCVADGVTQFLLYLAADYPDAWSVQTRLFGVETIYWDNGRSARFKITTIPMSLGALVLYPNCVILSDDNKKNALRIPVSPWVESVIRLVESELE